MPDAILSVGGYVLPFLVVLTILVFVHEMGHYLVARWCGVRVEVFSIGFGPELFGWTARDGTRWRLSAVPLGGYVKMLGEMGVSRPTSEQPADSFASMSIARRAAIVAAGPLANFLFAIAVLAVLFMTVGQPFTPARIGEVSVGSAAERAGLQAGDVIDSIDGSTILKFEDIQGLVQLNAGSQLEIALHRGDQALTVVATPDVVTSTDGLGNSFQRGLLGIRSAGVESRQHGPLAAVGHATRETVAMCRSILKAVGQYITGTRPAGELSGPLGIAQVSGEVAREGFMPIVSLMVVLSINLGLLNLFPIPMLDGGHLMFYAIEAVRGRPLGGRAQEFGFRIGLALVFSLMIYATLNDLGRFKVFDFLQGLLS
jgi:regulator of sigma E protease